MKIRYLSLIVLLVMSVFAPMQAQTYDNLWKELEVLERKALELILSENIIELQFTDNQILIKIQSKTKSF